MTRDELAEAVKARGLTAVEVDGENGDRLKVSRHRNLPYLDETITLKNGRPYWSWDTPIDGNTPDEVAERIDHIVSIPSSSIRNSA